MHASTQKTEVTPRLLSKAQLCQYTGLGTTKAYCWAKEIGAIRRLGRRTLYDRNVIDSAIDAMTPKEDGGNDT